MGSVIACDDLGNGGDGVQQVPPNLSVPLNLVLLRNNDNSVTMRLSGMEREWSNYDVVDIRQRRVNQLLQLLCGRGDVLWC